MPTYQYACTECGHDFEQFQSFHDDALTQCPTCGGRLRKVFNAVGVVFKGSGFYRTDSRSGSSATVPAASAETGSSGEKSAEKSSGEKSAGTGEKSSTSSGSEKSVAKSGAKSGAKPATSGSSTGSSSS